MVIVPKFKEEKLPEFDLKAGRQIFDVEKDRENTRRFAYVPKDTDNPIEILIRQACIANEEGSVNLKAMFFNKNVIIKHNHKYIKGKIKDIFMFTRDIYVKTRKGEVYVVPFDEVIRVDEREV